MVASVAGQRFDGEIVHEVSWENPFPAPDSRNVLAQWTRAREMALAGGFDALWQVEHDMWIPPEGLQRLADRLREAGVAYGVYLFRHGNMMLNTWEFVGWDQMGQTLSAPQNLSKIGNALTRQVVPVSGVGSGCTVIRRDVLAQIPMRYGQNEGGSPDMPFAMDCLAARIPQVAHFGVLCGHFDGQRWLMPLGSGDMGETVRVRAVRNIVVRLGGGTMEMIGGQEYDVPAYEVKQLLRERFVTVVHAQVERAILPAMEQAVKVASRPARRGYGSDTQLRPGG